MEINKLDPSQSHKVVSVLCAAFFNYPEFKYYFPSSRPRNRCLPFYLGNVIRTAMRFGEVYTNDEVSGVIFTLPPDHTKISQWEYIQCGFLFTPLVLGLQTFIRSQEAEDHLLKQHEEIMDGRSHYYLWGLVVDPSSKQKGIGTALLKPVLAKADAEKEAFYLETHDELNVAYYQRFGFQLQRTSTIPKTDVSVWSMVREPVCH
jgi:ribosomal protein S18 acetylase RimI-like enzyme